MKNDTKKITYGALMIAIFSIILLINRNTGGMLEEVFFYILPIPMVAYSARFGIKPSFPVVIAMGLMSIFLGTPLTIFYAVTEALIGMVMGGCVYHKVDMSKAVFAVMILSAVSNVLNTIVFASLFGYDIQATMDSTRTTMREVFGKVIEQQAAHESTAQSAVQLQTALESMLEPTSLFRILVLSMIVFGVIQGFLVYKISFLILNRLKFQIPKPKRITSFYPPRWTGVLAGLIFMSYTSIYASASDETIKQIAYTAGMCAFLYLLLFGFVAVLLLVRAYVSGNTLTGVIIAFAGYLLFSMFLMVLGMVYILTDYHKKWEEVADASDARRAEKSQALRTEYQRRMDEYKRMNPRGRR